MFGQALGERSQDGAHRPIHNGVRREEASLIGPRVNLDYRRLIEKGPGERLVGIDSQGQYQVASSQQWRLQRGTGEQAPEFGGGFVDEALGVIGGESRATGLGHHLPDLTDPPQRPVSQDQHRVPGLADHFSDCLRSVLGIGQGRRRGGNVPRHRGVHVDVHRSPGVSRCQPSGRLRRRGCVGMAHCAAPFGDRIGQSGLVELLVSHPGAVGGGHGVRHQHQGLAVQGGLGDPVDSRSHSRTPGDYRSSHRVGQKTVGGGRDAGGCLGVTEDERNALIGGGPQHLQIRAASRQSKETARSTCPKAGHNPAGNRFGH